MSQIITVIYIAVYACNIPFPDIVYLYNDNHQVSHTVTYKLLKLDTITYLYSNFYLENNAKFNFISA